MSRGQNRGNRNRGDKRNNRKRHQTGVPNVAGNTYAPRKISKPAPTFCDHWQGFMTLGDGLQIVVSSTFGRPMSYDTPVERLPIDLGFYLDNAWADDGDVWATGVNVPFASKATAKVIYPWRDYGTPDSIRMFTQATAWILGEMRSGKMVEVGCLGGHGRTGTLLACLLVSLGEDARTAVTRVRREHCHRAVESTDQENFVRKFDSHVNGRPYHPVKDHRRPAGYTKGTTWEPVAKPNHWTDGMSPATRADVADSLGDTAFVRDANDDDGWEYVEWQGLNAAGIAASLDHQAWPDRSEAEKCQQATGCDYPPCPHPSECSSPGEGCFRAEMWGPADTDEREGWI